MYSESQGKLNKFVSINKIRFNVYKNQKFVSHTMILISIKYK